jgi:UDP-3-O-[3-hydroxymyristoyl] N-acetylglucosamine deacetylase
VNFSTRQQRTIAQPVRVAGFGYWSGVDVNVEFRPAEPNSGVVFVRQDGPRPISIPATVNNRVETPRRTVLRAGGSSVEMIEHIMAALSGLQIDNCEVWVDAAEMPGMDGSAQPFVDALVIAGIVTQDLPRPILVVREVTRLGNAESWIEARPVASMGMSVKFHLDYGSDNAIGRQTLTLAVTPDSFRRELAASRTFMLKSEADWLVAQGLGQRTTLQDLLVFDAHGPIENELRYRDECVRHKTLDLLGDLALAQCDFVGHFIAYRSGHRLNADLVRTLMIEAEKIGVVDSPRLKRRAS